MNFLIFSNIVLPSNTAETKVAKLSSIKTISDASFATSVPDKPIATPISAFLSAGASFTPSPVIATTSFFFCKASTIFSLSMGLILANILTSSTAFESASLSKSLRSSLVSTFPSGKSNSFAIA